MDKAEEWFKQADYDFDTAKYMFAGRRYSYTVFMCHLCIEKALKGLYQVRFDETSPKIHNLLSLLLKLDIEPEKTMRRVIVLLSEASVGTRYPESLDNMQKDYNETVASEILSKTEDVMRWLKAQL